MGALRRGININNMILVVGNSLCVFICLLSMYLLFPIVYLNLPLPGQSLNHQIYNKKSIQMMHFSKCTEGYCETLYQMPCWYWPDPQIRTFGNLQGIITSFFHVLFNYYFNDVLYDKRYIKLMTSNGRLALAVEILYR